MDEHQLSSIRRQSVIYDYLLPLPKMPKVEPKQTSVPAILEPLVRRDYTSEQLLVVRTSETGNGSHNPTVAQVTLLDVKSSCSIDEERGFLSESPSNFLKSENLSSRHVRKGILASSGNVRLAKTQISLGIRPVWSESSLSTWRNLGSLANHWVHSEDSD